MIDQHHRPKFISHGRGFRAVVEALIELGRLTLEAEQQQAAAAQAEEAEAPVMLDLDIAGTTQ